AGTPAAFTGRPVRSVLSSQTREGLLGWGNFRMWSFRRSERWPCRRRFALLWRSGHGLTDQDLVRFRRECWLLEGRFVLRFDGGRGCPSFGRLHPNGPRAAHRNEPPVGA